MQGFLYSCSRFRLTGSSPRSTMQGRIVSFLLQSAASRQWRFFRGRFWGNTKTNNREVAMHMRPIDLSPHLPGCRAAARITTLLACFCAMLVLSAASSHAQTKLDVRKLFAEHLRNAVPSAAIDTGARVAHVSTR